MIRYAKKEELERVNELRKQVSDAHCKGRPDMCRNEFTVAFQNVAYRLWESKDSDVIVAVRDNIICGFASIEYINKPLSPYMLPRRYYHILELGVDKTYRRKKVATELFEFIRKESILKGFDRLELDVFSFNEGAVKFYESIGFSAYRIYMECLINSR
jgi:ribosomal protein S18 acetylase RimI-like enzyme